MLARKVAAFLLVLSALFVSTAGAQESFSTPTPTGSITLIFTPGNPNNDEPNPPVAGVNVLVQKLANIDNTTNEGVREASKLNIRDVLEFDDDAFSTRDEGASDTEGVFTLAPVEQGVYLISSADEDIFFTPFLLSLPHNNSNSVVAYPKFDIDEPAVPTTPGGPTFPWFPEFPDDENEPIPTPVPSEQIAGHRPDLGGPATTVPPEQVAGHRPTIPSMLANTGASVIAILIAGAALVLLGLVILRRNKKKQ